MNSFFRALEIASRAQAEYLSTNYNTSAITEFANLITDADADGSLLDVGCGDGELLRILGERYPCLKLYGLTASQREYNACGIPINVLIGDMHHLPWENNSFEIVTTRHSLEHSVAPLAVLLEINRVLRMGGKAIVAVPAPSSDWVMQWNDHFTVLSKTMWLKLFADAGFALETFTDATWVASYSLSAEHEYRFVLSKVYDVESQREFGDDYEKDYAGKLSAVNIASPPVIEKKIVAVIHNLMLFDAIKPLLERFRSDVKVIIPEVDSSGFRDMAEDTYRLISRSGFDVELMKLPAEVRCEIELSPYPYANLNVREAKYRVRFMYGLAKEAWNFSIKNNLYYDYVLTYGEYDTSILSAIVSAIPVGNMKIVPVVCRETSVRPTLLYAPTYGVTSSVEMAYDTLIELKNDYELWCKAHHGTSFLEPERVSLLKAAADRYFDHSASISDVLGSVDVVLSDGSGVIFDAIAAGIPVAVFQPKSFVGLGGTTSLEERILREGIIPSTRDPKEIPWVVKCALRARLKAQAQLRMTLFADVGRAAVDRAEGFVLELLGSGDTFATNLIARKELRRHIERAEVETNTRIIAERQIQSAYQGLFAQLLKDLKQFTQKVVELESQIILLNQGIAERDNERIALNDRVKEKEGHIGSLEEIVKDKNEQICSLTQKVVELESQIILLNQGIAERDGRINNLNYAESVTMRVQNEISIIKASKRYRYAERIAIILWYIRHPLQFIASIKNCLIEKLRNRLSSQTKRVIKKYILLRKEPAWQVPDLPSVFPIQNKISVAVQSSPSKYDVILLPVIDWDFRFQRPQQIALEFAKNGHRVFYIKTKFTNNETNQIYNKAYGVYEVQLSGDPLINLYVDGIDSHLLTKLEGAVGRLIEEYNITSAVVIVNLPFWKDLAVKLRESFNFKIVYDCMDKHSGFSTNSEGMIEKENNLTLLSDLVITTSQMLFDEQSRLNSKCVLIQNATDFAHFSAPVNGISTSICQLRKPVVGYYGAISDWFDTNIVADMAKKRPEWTIVLIGSTFGADLGPIKDAENILLLGEMPYTILPSYLHGFDVAIIPFKISPLTLATNPVKFFEYLSAGKPVVSVPLPELLPFESTGLVTIAYNGVDFVEKIDTVLQENDTSKIAHRIRFAQQHTWKKRFEKLNSEIISIHTKASIIIVTYNNVHLTQLCLESIFQKTSHPNFEVIVVDNSSSDGTKEYLLSCQQEHANMKVILNDFNAGFARANNQGIEASEGEYIILLNNDTIVTYGWITSLIYYLNRHPEVGMVGPVTNITGNEAKIEVTYSSIAEIDEFATKNKREHRDCYFEINMLSMFCVAFRKKLFDEIGPLDERFGIGMFEDDDYSLRTKQKGYKLICVEDVFIHHFHSASFKLIDQNKYLKMFEDNRKIFEQKWGVRWEPHKYRERKHLQGGRKHV